MMTTVIITCMLVNVVFFVALLMRKATMDVEPPSINNIDPAPSNAKMYSREEVDALVARLNKQLRETAQQGESCEYALSPPPYEVEFQIATRDHILSRNEAVLNDLREKVKGHPSVVVVVSWGATAGAQQTKERRVTGDPETIVSQVVSMIESWAKFMGGHLDLRVTLPASSPREVPSKVEVVYLNALGKPETEDIENRVAALVEVELANERARLKAGNNARLVN